MPIMSLPVLIAKTECKSFANSLHLYELLIFFSLASVKKRPHTLHLRFTFAAWISIQYCTYYSLKKLTSRSRIQKNRGYFSVLYMCSPMCADERYYFPTVFYRSVPPLDTLKVTLSFPAKDTWT